MDKKRPKKKREAAKKRAAVFAEAARDTYKALKRLCVDKK